MILLSILFTYIFIAIISSLLLDILIILSLYYYIFLLLRVFLFIYSYIEVSIRKKKWLLGCSYNPHKRFISSHLKELGKNLDFNSKYDNFILLGDLNAEPTNEAVNDFCQVYDCSNIIKKTLVSKIRKILPALI